MIILSWRECLDFDCYLLHALLGFPGAVCKLLQCVVFAEISGNVPSVMIFPGTVWSNVFEESQVCESQEGLPNRSFHVDSHWERNVMGDFVHCF